MEKKIKSRLNVSFKFLPSDIGVAFKTQMLVLWKIKLTYDHDYVCLFQVTQ